MTASLTSIFECGLRPPTPPTDNAQGLSISETIDFLQVDHPLAHPTIDTEVSGLGTPPKSSPITHGKIPSSREKKVGFRSWTVQHNGPSPKKTTPELRPLPQTRQARPLKSILKLNPEYISTPEDERHQSTGYFSPETPINVPKMLDSVVRSLSSSDLLMRLDGYQTINGALKAYNNFPNEDALRDRLPQLQASILRDIKLNSEDTRSTNLTTQALKLSIALFSLQSLSSSITNDFRGTLLDTALDVLGGQVLNKAITNHYLYLLSSPDFRPRSLDRAKAELLLTRLDGITNRISGNSVVAGRLTIYQRLIEQLPTVMLNKIHVWIEHIFHACLSSNQDICKRAIECGHRAGRDFGGHFAAKKAVMDFFASETTDNGLYGDYFIAKLLDMASDSMKRPLVPRIWSLVILFFQNKSRGRINEWPMFKPLGKVIQKCLYSSDINTKYQATLAWNRLVYVAGLDSIEPTKDRLLAVLHAPFSDAFEKEHAIRPSPEARKLMHMGYTNLLYYALQPSQSFERLDNFWDRYAGVTLHKMLSSGDKDCKFAERALKALFYEGAKSWDRERVLAPAEMKTEELPRLDPKWLRTRLPMLLATFEEYFSAALVKDNKGPDVYETPWRHLVLSVAQAGAQEIRTTTETKEALAHLVNFLRTIWSSANRWLRDSQPRTFIGHFGKMLTLCIEAFGPVVFLEDNISITETTRIQPAPTPSTNRSPKHESSSRSPFRFLMQMLCTPHEVLGDHDAILEIVESLLELILQSQLSTTQRLSLLQQCLADANQEASQKAQGHLLSGISEIMLAAAAATLRSDKENRPPSYEQLLKPATALLTDYLTVQEGGTSMTNWSMTFDTLASQMSSTGGDALVQMGLINGLSKAIYSRSEDIEVSVKMQIATIVITKATWITSRQQVDKAAKILGANQSERTKKSESIDKNAPTLMLINALIVDLYDNLAHCSDYAVAFMESTNAFLKMCPSAAVPILFGHLSEGCRVIMVDQQNKFAQASQLARAMRGEILTLWTILASHLRSLPQTSQSLEVLAPFMVAAFGSRHVEIVNNAISSWTSTFGQLTELTYPRSLALTLFEVAKYVSIDCPSIPSNFARRQESGDMPRLPAFTDGAYEVELGDRNEHGAIPLLPASRLELPQHTPARPGPVCGSSADKTQTPNSKAHPLPRLRHDDSQIEFVAIKNLPKDLLQNQTQSFTEHQKEVRDRQQQEAAGLLGPFTSSPMPSSTTKNLIVNRINERRNEENSGGRLSTPEYIEDQGLLEEILGSSPSAQSAQRAQSRSSRQGSVPVTQLRQPDFKSIEAEDDIVDIPSSPPEQPDDYVFDPEGVFSGKVSAGDVQDAPVEMSTPTALVDRTVSATLPPTTENTDLASTASEIPAEATALRKNGVMPRTRRSARRSATPSQNQEVAESSDRLDLDVSRVEDSFVGNENCEEGAVTPIGQFDGTNDPNNDVAVIIPRSRKRSNPDSTQTSNLRKRQRRSSPIKLLYDRIMGSRDDMETSDDEMEDCIVVATQPEPETTPLATREVVRSASQPQSSSVSAKRGRGRPKKATNAQPSTPIGNARTRLESHDTSTSESGLKRRSSRISGENVQDSQIAAPRKVRKQRESQDAKIAASNESETNPIEESGASENQSETSDDMELSPESQLRREAAQAAKIEERVMLSPRSILGRLRNMLSDVKEMGKKFVLRPQEQMEMSAVLFELGSETHAAALRGIE